MQEAGVRADDERCPGNEPCHAVERLTLGDFRIRERGDDASTARVPQKWRQFCFSLKRWETKGSTNWHIERREPSPRWSMNPIRARSHGSPTIRFGKILITGPALKSAPLTWDLGLVDVPRRKIV